MQGWSSWLWRGFNTAEVPGSIPGPCTVFIEQHINVYGLLDYIIVPDALLCFGG